MIIPTFSDRWIVTFAIMSEGDGQYVAVLIRTYTQEEIDNVGEAATVQLEVMFGLDRAHCHIVGVAPLVSYTRPSIATNYPQSESRVYKENTDKVIRVIPIRDSMDDEIRDI